MKKLFPLVLFLMCLSIEAQNDTIVNFLNRKGLPTQDKSEAAGYQAIIKRNDSLYKVMRFQLNGKLFAYWFSTSVDAKNKIGQSVTVDNNDSIATVDFYGKNGLKNGKSEGWFDNRNRNFVGRYVNGKKEGLWRFYHYNGKIAKQAFYRNDQFVKGAYFDEDGNKMQTNLEDCPEALFKGGRSAYDKEIKNIKNRIKKTLGRKYRTKYSFQMQMTYTVGVDGKIKDVTILNEVPKDVKSLVVNNIRNITGWIPKINHNRKLPARINNAITINFQ
jgi:hypothetical protein